ncbi:uncharacterized protein FIESC28_03064 [Fusarium coffeatum]|uniref:Uncharacterized protein n=1 Tax=Fusarium coffeatum TaxID=231269 RepID=A0A366S4C0_9HYPO|nr:uncharacterized protein FIESC28_03064 [Fusarium coffeatum]RBR24164.1 hypothetical protein FIESC28_03064 [Fusarium coffeatum]
MADNNPDPDPESPQQNAAEQPEEAKYHCWKPPALRKDHETQFCKENLVEVLEPRLLGVMDARWSSSFQEVVGKNNERFPILDDNGTASSETLAIDPRLQEATPPQKVFDFLSEPPKRPEIPEPRLANRWISERRLPPLQPQQICWEAEDRTGRGPRLFYYTPAPKEQEHNGVAYPQNGQEPPNRSQYPHNPYPSPPKQHDFYSGNPGPHARV